MSLEDITLPTNKSETRVSNNRRTIRSGEKGLAIKVTLVDANDQPYDLSAFTLEFNEIKDQGKIVLDDGSGDASGQFEKLDAKGGVFSYTLAPQVYSASGKCWFALKKGDAIIDTTKDFYFDVEKEASIHIDNDNYVSSLQAEIDHFKATTQRVDEDWSNLKSTMDSGYQGYVSDFDKLKSDWQSQTAKIDSDAQAQIAQIKADAKTQSDAITKTASDQSTAIQTKADTQLKSQADTFSSTLADQVKQIETKRDKTISDATAKFTADMGNWANQFNTWLTQTKSDYNSDIADLQSKLKTVQDFNENSKPDTNNDFLMTFNDNSESKTRLRDAFYAMVPDGAQTHNNIFRGQNLGALDATHIANIKNGTFRGMFIGDYFSINGSNYVIAGFNYKRHHGDTMDLGNHLVLMPQDWSKTPTQTLAPGGSTTSYMNDTATTAGGFAGSKLYQTYLPQIQTKLETDFGTNLMSFRTVVSTHVDDSGAPDQGAWRDAKVGIPNEVMIFGTTLNGNNKNGSWYNIGDENSQLPLMRLNDAERNFNRKRNFNIIGGIWLRDIHSASEFAYADNHGDAYWNSASFSLFGVRAFFLIG